MRIIKHAVLSIVRKPAKAVMIFTLLFVVFGLVFTGIIINNSLEKSKEFIRQKLGANVEMSLDFARVMKDQQGEKEVSGESMVLPIALAGELAKDPSVKALYLIYSSICMSPTLQSAPPSGDEGSSSTSIVFSTEGGQDTAPQGTPFSFEGTNQLVPLAFETGSLTLLEGRHREAQDEGKRTLLIPKKIADINNLTLGSTVELNPMGEGEPQNFEIIGIYEGASPYGMDKFYASDKDFKDLFSGTDGDYPPSSVQFSLNDPMEVDAFIARNEKKMPSEYIRLGAGDSEYKQLTRPLDLMSTITSVFLVVVFIAGAAILIAVATLFIRDRKFEIGLLLAGGEGKLKIVSQFILEIALVALVAFGAAAGASRLTSDFTASWIVKNQLVEENVSDNQNGFGFVVSNKDKFVGDVSIDDVAKNFDINVDSRTLLNLVLISFGLLLFSSSAPLLVIIGYKPRESLQS